jgi:hypothetical protein
VTRIEGTTGATLDDYRCFINAGTPNDFYNYQPFNLILTPQERTSVFTQGNYKFSDDVEGYAELLHSYTTLGIPDRAAAARRTQRYGLHPGRQRVQSVRHGVWIGRCPTSTRTPVAPGKPLATGLPNPRRRPTSSRWALRGKLFSTSWEWDASVGYGGIDQDIKTNGYLFLPLLAGASDPNFVDTDGTVRCGTPTAPIQGCIPVNPFNSSPSSRSRV